MQGINLFSSPTNSGSTVPNSEKRRVEEKGGLEKKVTSLRPSLPTLFSKRSSIGSNTTQIEEQPPLANKSTQDTSNLQVTEANEKIRKEIKELEQLTSLNLNYSDSTDAKISKEEFHNKLLSVMKSLQIRYTLEDSSSLKKVLNRLALKSVILIVGHSQFYSDVRFLQYKELPREVIKPDSSTDLKLLEELNNKMDNLLDHCFECQHGFLVNQEFSRQTSSRTDHQEILIRIKEEFNKINQEETLKLFVDTMFSLLSKKANLTTPPSLLPQTSQQNAFQAGILAIQDPQDKVPAENVAQVETAQLKVQTAQLEKSMASLSEDLQKLSQNVLSQISQLKKELVSGTSMDLQNLSQNVLSQISQLKGELVSEISIVSERSKSVESKAEKGAVEALEKQLAADMLSTKETLSTQIVELELKLGSASSDATQAQEEQNERLIFLENQMTLQSNQISEQKKLIEDLSSQIKRLQIELQKVTESKLERIVSSQPSSPFQAQTHLEKQEGSPQEVLAQASLSPEVKKHEELIPSTTEKQASLDTEIERKVEALQEEDYKKSENSLFSSPPDPETKELTPGVSKLKNMFEPVPQSEQPSPVTPTRIDSLQGNVGTLKTMWAGTQTGKKSGPFAEALDALQLKGAVAAHRATSQAQAKQSRLSDPTLSDSAPRAKKKK